VGASPSGGTYDEPVTSVVTGAQPRAVADRCPGLLRPHVAEDGLLVRIRLPGGQTTSRVLLGLSRLAGAYGEGSLQLTSRGNVQLRGLREAQLPELVDEVAALGLLPSETHERVRNILASPLSGLDGSRPDVRQLTQQLDAAVCAKAELSELPGRFLFAFDDGSRDVSSVRFDLAWRAGPGGSGVLLVGGPRHGIPVHAESAVDLMVTLALRFVRLRPNLPGAPWHVAELADPAVLDPRISALDPLDPSETASGSGAPQLGAVGTAASVGVPLSLLTASQVAALHAAAGGGPVVVTPWRGVVVPDGAISLPALAAAGLLTHDRSTWSALTACVGSPGCAKSAISTRGLATALTAALDRPTALPVHVSGCPRRCGAPSGAHVDLVAPDSVEQALDEIALAS
jgi:precorrin-3B synthase